MFLFGGKVVLFDLSNVILHFDVQHLMPIDTLYF